MDHFWQQQRFFSLNASMREVFHDKVIKLSLDGGFSCPNRQDGSGCIFCSDEGSGEFAGRREKSIREQIASQKTLLKDKWPNGKYLAYFQNFTNTYGDVERMRQIFYQALDEDVVGLAIATRADCLSDDVLDLLEELNEKTFLWIEIGAQTLQPTTITWMNRGYSHQVLTDGIKRLQSRNIRVCLHWIIGFPNEGLNDHLAIADYCNEMKIWGVKIHMLHIVKGTALARWYVENPYSLYEMEEYTDIVCEMLYRLNNRIVVHRMTGDGKKDKLIAPWWILNKRAVLNSIDRKMREKHYFQGGYRQEK